MADKRSRVPSSRYYDQSRNAYVTPCKRCGRRQQAEACVDCRESDPLYADAMNARDWQAHLRAKFAAIDNAELIAEIGRRARGNHAA